VAVYRATGGGWLGVNQALGLQYRLPANAFDSFPKPITAMLGVGKPAAAGGTKPGAHPGAHPGAVTPTKPKP
jgi:hypothetical protein